MNSHVIPRPFSSSLILGMITLTLVIVASGHVEAQKAKIKKLGEWGTITDPDADCEFDESQEKLRITVPATNHDLTLTGGQKAPRVLQKVSGEFTVQVKVTGEFKPGLMSVGKNVRPYNGAGILIWQNERNYVRVERNSYWIDQQILNCYPPQTAYFSGGQLVEAFMQNPTTADFFQGKSTWLKVRRQGANLFVWLSHDGQQWTEIKKIPVKLSDQLSVGVVAVNTSSEPFVVDFSGFSIEKPKK